MHNKASRRKHVQRFYCPCCDRRLWTPGGSKYFLAALEADIRQNDIIFSKKNSVFLASQGSIVNINSWIEEFFCGEHGQLWLKVTRKPNSELVATVATTKDWQRTIGTLLGAPYYPARGFTRRTRHRFRRKLTSITLATLCWLGSESGNSSTNLIDSSTTTSTNKSGTIHYRLTRFSS